MLRSIAASGTTVLAVCSEAPEDALTVRTTPVAEDALTKSAAEDAPTAPTTEKETADAIAEAGRA